MVNWGLTLDWKLIPFGLDSGLITFDHLLHDLASLNDRHRLAISQIDQAIGGLVIHPIMLGHTFPRPTQTRYLIRVDLNGRAISTMQ
jgi:hypothetical protein